MKTHAALLALLGFLMPLLAADTAHAGEFDLETTKEVLQQLAERELDRGVASVSLALVRDGEIVWKAAYGYANYRMKTPATPETIYVTGSTFKAVTATGILQLVEQGKCKLDDPINQYLGEDRVHDNKEKPVTFRHILSHTSGLNPGDRTVNVWSRTLPASLEELTGELSSVRPVEEIFEYNNFAYGTAGLLIEKISGMSYEDYILEYILKPLGVTTPGPVEPTPEMVERLALPYAPGSGGVPRPIHQVRFDVFPAGDIYLTAEDMARFLAAHLNGGAFQDARILSEESITEAHTKQFFDYGLGWWVGKSKDGHAIIEHAGGVPGVVTYMAGDIDANVGAYVMSNSGNMRSIATAALTLLQGEEYVFPKDRKEIELDPAKLEGLTGTYELSPQFRLFITREGDRLFFQATGQRKAELHSESETKFFLKDVDAQVTFNRNASGTVNSIVMHQYGRDQEAKRKAH